MTDDTNDLVGLEIRTSQEERIVFWKLAAIACSVGMALSVCGNVALGLRPPIVRYVRIDAIRGATPLRYNDLDYTPQLGEVGKTLIEWVQYRERRLPGVMIRDYRNNFYFVDRKVSAIAMQSDTRDEKVARVETARTPESTIEQPTYEFSDFRTLKTSDGTLAKGSATVRFTRIIKPGAADQKKEDGSYTIQFYVNPQQVTELAEKDPLFAQINPLGVTVTGWFESRPR